MVDNEQRHAVGTFATREDAELALQELRGAGFDMDRVSVIAQNVEPRESIGGAEVSPVKVKLIKPESHAQASLMDNEN